MTKPTTIWGLLGKKEVSYNGGGALSTATDGILLDELPKLVAGYANDGGRPAPPAIVGLQRRVPPVGRFVTLSPKVSAKGAGAAYSASVVPGPIHVLLQCAGFDAAVTLTGGSEKWVYTPTAETAAKSSGVFGAYARQQLYALTGALCDLNITADGPVVPTWEFPMSALMSAAITDVSLPAITYPALTIDPPKATNITLILGNLTAAVVRKWSLKLGRTIAPRLDQNAGGHAGFGPGRQTPQLDITFEATTLTNTPFTTASLIDPYQLFEAGTNFALSWQTGNTQYNRIKYAAGAAQIMSAPVEDEDGPTALWTLSLQLNPSTLNANDWLTITAD